MTFTCYLTGFSRGFAGVLNFSIVSAVAEPLSALACVIHTQAKNMMQLEGQTCLS